VSGNGKTTFARRLAAQIDVPYTELDALCHLPGWRRATETSGARSKR
jgi:adenylate kinase family enzyme